MEAEAVRDIALRVSGLLDPKFGGPSVRPYQPDGYLAALNFPKRDYPLSKGSALYRRSLYTHWQRTFLHPSLLAFDAPTREECTVNRSYSNTPLQSLVLLNDPIYVEAARVFATRLLAAPGTWDQRLQRAFAEALGRAPMAAERQALASLHTEALQEYRRAPQAAKDLVSVGETPVPASISAAELAADDIGNQGNFQPARNDHPKLTEPHGHKPRSQDDALRSTGRGPAAQSVLAR